MESTLAEPDLPFSKGIGSVKQSLLPILAGGTRSHLPMEGKAGRSIMHIVQSKAQVK